MHALPNATHSSPKHRTKYLNRKPPAIASFSRLARERLDSQLSRQSLIQFAKSIDRGASRASATFAYINFPRKLAGQLKIHREGRGYPVRGNSDTVLYIRVGDGTRAPRNVQIKYRLCGDEIIDRRAPPRDARVHHLHI